MLIITNDNDLQAFLADPPDPNVAALVTAHAERLADFELEEIAIFAVCQPDDHVEQLEAASGRPILDEEGNFTLLPEIHDEHEGWHELVFILSDDGFGLVLFIAKHPATDARLLKALAPL